MSQNLRIAVCTVPQGPWSMLADLLEAQGAAVLRLAPDIDLPPEVEIDGLVTTPAPHQTARFDRLDLDAWDASFADELDRRFRTGRQAARVMAAGPGGCIIHLVPSTGLPGAPDSGSAMIAAYASAGLSRGIALDLKDKLRSNTLALDTRRESLAAAANLILWLCGQQGRDVTGQIASIGPTELQLFAQSRPLRIAHRDSGWDEPGLAAQTARWASCLPCFAETGELL